MIEKKSPKNKEGNSDLLYFHANTSTCLFHSPAWSVDNRFAMTIPRNTETIKVNRNGLQQDYFVN